MKWTAVIILLWVITLVLTYGCAPMTRERVTTVDVLVTTPCRKEVAEPMFADTPEALHAAPGIDIRTYELIAGRIQRDAYIDKLKAAGAGCQVAPSK